MNEVQFFENGKKGIKTVAKIIEQDKAIFTTNPPKWFIKNFQSHF